MQETGTPATTFAIETHGCKLNQADTLTLAGEFTRAGLRRVEEDEVADVYVVNSCTVTHVADRKARQSIRAARRRNPSATIVATGCYAERSPEQLRALDEIDLLFGNVDKPRLVRQVLEWRGGQAIPCATGDDIEHVVPRVGRSRAMVKIQEGCDQVCAYCIVPRVRGRERSIPTDLLVSEIGNLVANGYREVVLTGTQLGSYGFDLKNSSLLSLIDNILRRTPVERLRVSSLQPREITDDLLRLWENERLCPHFHLPLQSGSNRILKEMRRRYTAEEYADTVERIRRRVGHASVTTDVIVGFPGETEEDFVESFQLCRGLGFADTHVFPYSVRPGTSAAHYDDQVSPQVKKSRMDALLTLSRSKARDFRIGAHGTERPVLWETRGEIDGEPVWTGLTDNYIRVRARSNSPLLNVVTLARLGELDEDEVVRAEVI